MRFGIFADIHSNFEALTAVVEDMTAQRVTHPICLGDVVGYNANPRECLELVQSLNCPIIMGNHDEAAAAEQDPDNFNKLALVSIRHTKEQLTAEQKNYLSLLPLTLAAPGLTLVHANLADPSIWYYLVSPTEAAPSMEVLTTPLAFFGHTHVPHLFVDDGKTIKECFYNKFSPHPQKRYFINVGSVGQPRDGDWRSAYVICDTDKNTIELRRLTYDLPTAQAKILKAGLPRRLAERLGRAD